MFRMTSETVPATIVRQRKRYEALGNALKKASGMSSFLKTLFITTLVFGLPTLALLGDPLKDSLSYTYHLIIFGFRILIISMTLILAMKFTPEMYTAQNDLEKKLEEVGYKNEETNTAEEKRLVYRSILFKFIRIFIIVGSFFGLFLLSNRTNYGYIIGQQIIYVFIVTAVLMTTKFWFSKKHDYSPLLGGRAILNSFLPVLFFIGLEIILDFFSVLSEPRFRYNTLQISWGITYPFIFILILLAVLFTTKKTKREKAKLQDAKLSEFQRKETFIHEKGIFKKMSYNFQVSWNKITPKKSTKGLDEDENLDKKPNKYLVESIWMALFITVIPFTILVPWIIFPHDGMLILAFLMFAYQFSISRYDRYEIDVFFDPEKNEKIAPTEIRTKELPNNTFILILLPTMVFVVAQYMLSGVITQGIFNLSNELIVTGFTWIAVLMLIPISIQMIYKLIVNANENRTINNLALHRNVLITILVLEVVLLAGSFLGRIIANALNYTFIQPIAIYLQATMIGILIIIPLLFHLIAPKLDDIGYKRFKIGTSIFVILANCGIVVWFIFEIILRYFG